MTEEQKALCVSWDNLSAAINSVLVAQPHGMTEAAGNLAVCRELMKIAVNHAIGFPGYPIAGADGASDKAEAERDAGETLTGDPSECPARKPETPVEAIARAIHPFAFTNKHTQTAQEDARSKARAALLALAECTLPEEAKMAGTAAGYVALDDGVAPTPHVFRAICRAAADAHP